MFSSIDPTSHEYHKPSLVSVVAAWPCQWHPPSPEWRPWCRIALGSNLQALVQLGMATGSISPATGTGCSCIRHTGGHPAPSLGTSQPLQQVRTLMGSWLMSLISTRGRLPLLCQGQAAAQSSTIIMYSLSNYFCHIFLAGEDHLWAGFSYLPQHACVLFIQNNTLSVIFLSSFSF